MRNLTATVLLLLASLLSWPTPVAAGVDEVRGAGTSAAEGGVTRPSETEYEVEIEYNQPGEAISLGANPFVNCTIVWSISGNEALDYGGARGQFEHGFDPTISTSLDLFHFMSCPHASPPILQTWPDSEPTPPLILNALYEAAQSRLQIPVETPQSNPPGTADFPVITQLSTWFWSSSYNTQTATASLAELAAPVDASITITATPTSTTWDPGDGAPAIDCDGGVKWIQGFDEQDTTCSHTYTTRSDGQAFTLAATTNWDLTVTCQPSSICIDLPVPRPVSVTTTRDVHVISIYPVLTN